MNSWMHWFPTEFWNDKEKAAVRFNLPRYVRTAQNPWTPSRKMIPEMDRKTTLDTTGTR